MTSIVKTHLAVQLFLHRTSWVKKIDKYLFVSHNGLLAITLWYHGEKRKLLMKAEESIAQFEKRIVQAVKKMEGLRAT